MWEVNGTNLNMVEGDFGIALPITVDGITLQANDSIRITFKDNVNGNTLLEKEYTFITNNTISLVFTKEQSELFPVGIYAYSFDWYHDGTFMCNIVPQGMFRVVDKA